VIRRNFRVPQYEELKSGLAIWLDGRHFEDTNPVGPYPHDNSSQICGPFLVERVLFGNMQGIREPRVDLVDPTTGRRRSMMCSWLLVPRENK